MAINFFESEKQIAEYWKENNTFQKSLQKKGKNFVFYEGPPTANGKPGIHHVVARAFKDLICRYKTMRGFVVKRKAGWDTHGLPVEIEAEKSLGLHSKKEIEQYGIDKFNKKCRESVWQYVDDWKDLTQKIGYWLDMDNPYITYDPPYMESVWWIIRQIADKGLLYQGHKVVPYCPRCGTALSSHEVAQGYSTIKEPSIFIKFRLKKNNHKIFLKYPDLNLLVWTTTPWTLPANVAIAVNENIQYILISLNDEKYILAESRKEFIKDSFDILETFSGKELKGLEYEPLFGNEFDFGNQGNMYKILSADFVSTEDGSGLVHIAPAFGEDDMNLIQEWNSKHEDKFPILLTVDLEGKFKSEIKTWAGMFVKDADPLITQYLKEKGKIFLIQEYEHEYPFCWRCKTPLLYYAKESWFVKMSALKEKLQKNNENINWIPSHVKTGRFGEWLEDVKDWAISRERYWGTPLPIWKCQCGYREVIGSREDLRKQKFSDNKYFVVRHGHSQNIVEDAHSSYPEPKEFPLTEQGVKEVNKAAQNLKKEKIDMIFSSDIFRTKQTAEIIAKELGLEINYDERLRETDAGEFNGRKRQEVKDFFLPKEQQSLSNWALKRFTEPFPGGEKYGEVRIRLLQFFKELEEKYQGKNILIVSHIACIYLIESSFKGLGVKESADYRDVFELKPSEIKKYEFKDFPYDENGEIDLHRPYIDQIEFDCPKCGKKMKRVSEVIDCWFDSGSMPFSQYHYPFENEKLIEKGEQFPADYISEGIDQTRGWFYTLLAISTLLGKESPYKNVIALGHVLDQKGQKMSKSLGNIVDPWQMIEKYGADALRWYCFTVNQPGDPKLFNEKDLDQALKQFLMTFWNCVVFLKTYSAENISFKPIVSNILDKWILSRLNSVIEKITSDMNQYDASSAARLIQDFVINDLSLWYVRRSRQRFQQPKSERELKDACSTLSFVLMQTVKICAPFVPFLSEKIYQKLDMEGSVHLQDWPETEKKMIDKNLEKEMITVREIASLGLGLRNQAGIKVRQPLEEMKISIKDRKLNRECLDVLSDELNIKKISLVDKMLEEKDWIVAESFDIKISLNTKISEELKEEGMLRDIVRFIQDTRKKSSCIPKDNVVLNVMVNETLKLIFIKNETEILSQTKSKEIKYFNQIPAKTFAFQQEGKVGEENIWLGIEK